MEGWIKLHRQITENWMWTSEPFTRGQAWVDLLLLATHQESFFYVRGVKVNLTRGQIAWSESKLSNRWGWSRTKLRKFLKDLEKEQQIRQQKGNVIQVVTILNYEKYQQKEPQTGQQKDRRKTAKEPQKNIYKNEKNYNNVKNEKKITVPQEFDSIFLDWFKYKDERKEYYVEIGMIKLVNQYLTKGSPTRFRSAVDYSISNNWKGIFEEKNNNTTKFAGT